MGNQDPRALSVVGSHLLYNPVMIGKKSRGSGLLAVAQFHHHHPRWSDPASGAAGQPSQHVQPVWASIKGNTRVVVPNLGLEMVDLARGDVRRIGDDQVERQARREGYESIPAMKGDPLVGPMTCGILTRDRQGIGREVNRMHPGLGQVMGQRHRQTTASGAEIKNLEWMRVLVAQSGQSQFGQDLSFGAGDKDAMIDFEFEAVKDGGAQNVLQRFAPAASLNQVPDGLQVGLRKQAIELQVELQARNGEPMRQEPLHLEPGRVHAFAGQVFGAASDHFEHRHSYGLNRAADFRARTGLEQGRWRTVCGLKHTGGQSSFRFMRRAWICGALAVWVMTAPDLSAQSDGSRAAAIADREAAEERYRRLNTAVEGMLGAQAEQQRRLDALAAELQRVRTETARAGGDFVTRSELNELVKTIQEIDRKREQDRRVILEELAALGKSLAELVKSPPRRTEPPPAQKPATGSPAFQEFVEHTVQPRETIWALVTAYNAEYRAQGKQTSEKLIMEANPKVRAEALIVGQKIVIPLVPR
jgi:hypothetical protein